MSLKKKIGTGFIVLGLASVGFIAFKSMETSVPAKESTVLSAYANIALSNFTDSKESAVALRDALEAFTAIQQMEL